jgi:predicted transcriptional regulator of viral defense system
MIPGEHSLTQFLDMCHPMYSVKLKSLKKSPFSYQDALTWGVSRRALQRLLRDGHIERIGRGVYRDANRDDHGEDSFRNATALVGAQSAICLLSALSEHGLTDIIPKRTWIMVPAPKRTTVSFVRLVRKRNPKWKVGITTLNGYSITTVERTIVDTLCSSDPGLDEGLAALKKALNQRRTTPAKIAEVARQLGVYDRLLPYLRAVS